jgi:hypothetical protein
MTDMTPSDQLQAAKERYEEAQRLATMLRGSHNPEAARMIEALDGALLIVAERGVEAEQAQRSKSDEETVRITAANALMASLEVWTSAFDSWRAVREDQNDVLSQIALAALHGI